MAKKPYFKVAGISVVALVVAWLIIRWATPKPYLEYSTDTFTFHGESTLPGEMPDEEFHWDRIGEWVYRWIQDVNSDGIPDLAISNSDQPPWISRKSGMKDWIWTHRVYSGGNGALVREVVWNDDEIEILDILGADGDVESIRYLVQKLGGTGTQSLAQDFRPTSLALEPLSPSSIWAGGINGPFANAEYDPVEVGYHDSSIPITTLQGSLGDIIYFVLPDEPESIPTTIAHLWSGVWNQEFEEKDHHYLATYEIPGGKLIRKIDIWNPSLPDFDPEAILTHFDINQDGQKDWFIKHTVDLPSDKSCWEYSWLDGIDGALMKPESTPWSRLKTIPPAESYPDEVATRSGLFEIIEWPVGSEEEALQFRPWTNPSHGWTHEFEFDTHWGIDLDITEFPDLDGDSFPDFGLVAKSWVGSQSALLGSWAMPLIAIEAKLVSGATGKAITGH